MKSSSLSWLFICFPLWLTSQQTEKKVILQGFWWDYENRNYPNGWANYLTDLAPRLRDMGIDGVWIPPSVKNYAQGNSPGVGYAPFDHYDLGDKFQKGQTATRLGTKDELLRMVAVLHANGLEVIQDIVPNHVIGAGSVSGGAGGIDPASTNDPYSNFRYVCYATPAQDNDANDYLSRRGRFPKNYQNFHPNNDHNCNDGDICRADFGPDICYFDLAHGQSSNAIYNPIQTGGENNGYMRRNMREWLIWYKKQLGFDGVRIDAVKHFDFETAEDFMYNLQFNAGFASGGDAMFAVGEYVGGMGDLDNWYNAVQRRAGVFDFSLREYHPSRGLYGMIYGLGNYNISQLPSAQQTGVNRVEFYPSIQTYVHRTVPFINNHDTFRPRFDASGRYIGWKTGDELSPHIEPNEPRLATAYAIIFAMDGSPQVFFEDLFDIGYEGNRFNHDPRDENELPVREDIVNLIKCHQQLDFKSGAYKVRSSESGVYFAKGSAADHLIIERSAKAIIGINDHWDTWQNAWIDSDFAPGTRLMDFSGANGIDVKVVQNDQRVNINTPPVNPELNLASRHGYSVWAPVREDLTISSIEDLFVYLDNYRADRATVTIQEWEMADDLGDSHCASLGQGGKLPRNSCSYRVVGKIFTKAGSPVSCLVFPADTTQSVTLSLFDLNGVQVSTLSGFGELALDHIPTRAEWLSVKVRNNGINTAGQTLKVRVSYEAPKEISTQQLPGRSSVSFWNGNGGDSDWTNCQNWEEGLIPNVNSKIVIPDCLAITPQLPRCFRERNILGINGSKYNRPLVKVDCE